MEDRFASMRSKGINTYDADATAEDILEGKTAYVAGQKITGTGTGGTAGILPMPITSLVASQIPYQRGKEKVRFNIPTGCTAVDILLKENAIPQDIDDYDQKVTIDNPQYENEITIQPNAEDNSFAFTYGMWAMSQNANGVQTAISAGNRIEFSPLYASGLFSEVELVTSDSTAWSTVTVDCTQKGNLVFINSNSGLLLLDLSDGSFTQLTTGAVATKPTIIEADTDKWIIACGTSNFIFNPTTKNCVSLDYNKVYCGIYNDYAFFVKDSSGTDYAKAYKISTGESITIRKNTNIRRFFVTNKGAFLCEYDKIWVFNTNTESCDSYINKYYTEDEQGNIIENSLPTFSSSSSSSTYYYKILEDDYGTVWILHSSFCGIYDGTRIWGANISISTSIVYDYDCGMEGQIGGYGTVYKGGAYKYFISNGLDFEIIGTDTGSAYLYPKYIIKTIRYRDGIVICSLRGDYLAIFTFNQTTGVISFAKTETYEGAQASFSNSISQRAIAIVGDDIYWANASLGTINGANTQAFCKWNYNGYFEVITTWTTSSYIYDMYKIDDYMYVLDPYYNKYKRINLTTGTIEEIYSPGNSMIAIITECVKSGNYVYLIPKNNSTNYNTPTGRYDIQNETSETLTDFNYIRGEISDKHFINKSYNTIYNIEDDSTEAIAIGGCSALITNGRYDTKYGDLTLVIYRTSNKIKCLYTLPAGLYVSPS